MMQVPLADVTPDQLKSADSIVAVDPIKPSFRQHIYSGVAMGRAPYAGPHVVQQLEVLINSSEDTSLRELLSKVEAAKGHLPADIQLLRE